MCRIYKNSANNNNDNKSVLGQETPHASSSKERIQNANNRCNIIHCLFLGPFKNIPVVAFVPTEHAFESFLNVISNNNHQKIRMEQQMTRRPSIFWQMPTGQPIAIRSRNHLTNTQVTRIDNQHHLPFHPFRHLIRLQIL
jgi:hypothetical protein